LKHDKR